MNEKRTWESDMSDAFDRRVRDLHEAPLSFEQVTTRARGIRRRRQAAVAGAVLAVAAVATPMAVVVGSDGPGRDDGVPAATNTPSPTATDAPSPSATDSPSLPDNGSTPIANRLEDGDYVRGDGTVYDLPEGTYTRADLLGSELVAYRVDTDTGEGTIDVFDAPVQGGPVTPTESIPAVDGYVTDPLGLVIAYKTPEGEVWTRWDGGETSFGTDVPVSAVPAAVTGGPTCDEEADGCVVYLNIGDASQAPIAISADGTVDTPVPDVVKINDVDAGGVASVQISSDDTGSCSGLYDLTAGDYLFETCRNTLGAISPSGAHVIAGPPYLDGLGSTSIAILDREGFQVAGRRLVGGFIGSQVWEDPGHVVFTEYANGGWSIHRMGIDGKFEQLTDPVPGDEVDAPITFFS